VIDLFIDFVKSVVDFLVLGVEQFYALDWQTLLVLFWFTFIFDLPRYLIPDLLAWMWDILWGVENRLRPPRERDPVLERKPLVSVIVPALNAEATIASTIETILETDWPNKEVIVVDDGSDDRTFAIASDYARRDRRVKVFRKKYRGGKASALNLGFQASRGEFIIAVDSDTSFERESITNLIRRFEDPRVGAVSGNLRVKNQDKSLCTRLQACEYLQTISIARIVLSSLNLLMVVCGAFGAFRRDVLVQTGGWDPGIGDDSNMTVKARKLRPRVAFAPDARAYTSVPETWTKLWVQRKRWDKNFVRNRLKKHANILNPTRFHPSNLGSVSIEFFYRVLLLVAFYAYLVYLFLFFPHMLPLVVVATFVIYGLANYVSLFAAVMVSKQYDQLELVLYAPLMLYYRLFLRAVRTVAYIEEFLRLNYRDPFYPTEVWENIPQW